MVKRSYTGGFKLDIVASIEQRSRFLWTRTPHTHRSSSTKHFTHIYCAKKKSSLISTDAVKSKTCTFTRVKSDKRGKYSPFLASRVRHPAGENSASAREEKQKSWGTKFPPSAPQVPLIHGTKRVQSPGKREQSASRVVTM